MFSKQQENQLQNDLDNDDNLDLMVTDMDISKIDMR